MKKYFLFLIINFTIGICVFGQNVGIGTSTPHSSSALDITDTSRGILIPRMTFNQRNNIANPSEGLMVYQIDSSKGFWYFNGLLWKNFNSQNSSGGSHMKIFTSSESFMIPNGVNSVIVELWGGGGGGGRSSQISNFVRGGCAGGYGKSNIDVISGQSYSVIVGIGGAGIPSGGGGIGGTGGNSSFGDIIIATGGEGGGENYVGTPGSCNSIISCTGNIGGVSSGGTVGCFNYGYGNGGNGASGPCCIASTAGTNGLVVIYW